MMGTIADKVATMGGCSLRQIVDEIARMEANTVIVPALPSQQFDEFWASDAPDAFDVFWKAWPHKVGKPDAKKAYAAALKRGIRHSAIMEGLAQYIHDKPPDRPWLNPATFIRQERFNDRPAPVAAKPSKTSELRNDLRNRIGERSEDTGYVRRLPQRQPIA